MRSYDESFYSENIKGFFSIFSPFGEIYLFSLNLVSGNVGQGFSYITDIFKSICHVIFISKFRSYLQRLTI